MSTTITSVPGAEGVDDPAQDQQREPVQDTSTEQVDASGNAAGAANGQPAEGNADAAFAAFQDDTGTPADQSPTTATDATAPAPTAEKAKQDGAPPESQAAPQGKDGAQPPASPPKDDSDPTQAERERGLVSIRKLDRALEARRRFKDTAAKLESELNQERQFSDKLLGFYERAGITQDQVPAFMEDLFLASQGNAEAQQRLGSRFKLAPTSASTTVDEAALEEVAAHAAEYGDPKVALALWREKRGKAKPPAAPAPAQQQPAQAPTAPAAGARQADPAMAKLGGQIRGMADSLVSTFGKDEADQIGGQIEQRAGDELTRLQRMGVAINPEVVGNVYREAHGHVLASRGGQRRAPTRAVRSTQPAPIAQRRNADQAFEAFQDEGA